MALTKVVKTLDTGEKFEMWADDNQLETLRKDARIQITQEKRDAKAGKDKDSMKPADVKADAKAGKE